MALVLMHLYSVRDRQGVRARKTLAREITDRLFEKDYIGDPKGRAKSVSMRPEGARLSEELFRKAFRAREPK